MLITVLVPTYRRPHDLLRCLKALAQQTRPIDQLIVAIRDIDTETWEALQTVSHLKLPLQTVEVTVPGLVAAMNAGLSALKGDILTITDDDSVPHPDWIERIEKHFLADDQIGGVGGRDYVYHGEILEDGAATVVGKLSWFGRAIGNHHIGVDEICEVDILKGVNMSFRQAAIKNLKFDERMRGTGAQVHYEFAFSLTVQKQGWKLIYDPKVAVDHYPAQRFDEDQRHTFNTMALTNAVHNETISVLEYLSPIQRIVFLLWSLIIGTQQSFGLLQCLRFFPKEGLLAAKKWVAAMQGRWQGYQTWQSR
ncbi:MAG: glycosyl transferase family A [Leptolyngbya sp.]|nr:MAG: glycosyl transferase family A [Leptolyngbya sp.]